MELLNEGLVESVSVESDQSDNLIRLLDTVVIKLEGGDEEDLKVLDEKPKPLPLIERPAEAEVIIENSEEATPVTSAVDEVANPEKKVTEEVPKGSPQKEKESDDLPELEKSESNDETAEEKKESTEEDSKDIEMKDDTEEEKIEEEKIEKPKKPEKAKKKETRVFLRKRFQQ
uniref:Serrate RNA effector molecule-like protein n=1 Tax=Panorpa liui TaxID=706606 RepID=A0A7G4WGB5_9NEOP|nr:serrate RNA effector molecule-like protein [Panorpa liui]